MKAIKYLFPFYELYRSSKKINQKIQSLTTAPEKYEFEYATTEPTVDKDILAETLSKTMGNKKELEDKAKSSLIAITISSALIFNIMKMLQDMPTESTAISVILAVISCISLSYMVSAGILSLYTLSEINKVCFPFPEDYLMDEQEQKEGLAQAIEENYLYNVKRNNFMNTSYRCIIVSITLFVLIFIVSSLSTLTMENDNVLDDNLTTIENRLMIVEEQANSLANADEDLHKQIVEIENKITSMLERITETDRNTVENKNEVLRIVEKLEQLKLSE